MVTVPNVTEMIENIEINNLLHRRRKMCEHIKKKVKSFFLKNSTDPFPHYTHVRVLERGEHVDLR